MMNEKRAVSSASRFHVIDRGGAEKQIWFVVIVGPNRDQSCLGADGAFVHSE